MEEPMIMWPRRRKRTGPVNSAHSSTNQQLKPAMPASRQELRVSLMFVIPTMSKCFFARHQTASCQSYCSWRVCVRVCIAVQGMCLWDRNQCKYIMTTALLDKLNQSQVWTWIIVFYLSGECCWSTWSFFSNDKICILLFASFTVDHWAAPLKQLGVKCLARGHYTLMVVFERLNTNSYSQISSQIMTLELLQTSYAESYCKRGPISHNVARGYFRHNSLYDISFDEIKTV